LDSALISAMDQIEDTHFWYWAKRRLIRQLVFRYSNHTSLPTLLDVGCGTGRLMADLSDCAKCIGVDASSRAVQLTEAKNLIANLGIATKLPFPNQSFDFVVMSDVLEHIDDDALALNEVFRVLNSRGIVIITVPAHPFLYGTHDRALSHVRRYDKRELKKVINQAGFEITKLTPTNMLLLLPAVIQKIVEHPHRQAIREGELPSVLNNIVRAWYYIENAVTVRVGLPFGLSFLVVAQKNAN
jgi:ubiquinone/menaquinone biosynthesis C-methylase UbiE